jgi:hypothetical protein
MRKREINQSKKVDVKKERLVSFTINLPIVKILWYSFLIIFLWYILFYKKYIYIYLTDYSSKNIRLFFSILVGLTYLMYIVSTGIRITYSKKIVIIIVLVIIILLILGINDFGLGLEFRKHYGLLSYNVYESDSVDGLRFYYRNLSLWLIVWIMAVVLTGDD